MMKMSIAMMMGLSSGVKVIKNAGLIKQKLKKNFYLLLDTHQDYWIGVFLKMKKRNRKIVGISKGFFVSGDRIQQFLSDLKGINKNGQLDSNNP